MNIYEDLSPNQIRDILGWSNLKGDDAIAELKQAVMLLCQRVAKAEVPIQAEVTEAFEAKTKLHKLAETMAWRAECDEAASYCFGKRNDFAVIGNDTQRREFWERWDKSFRHSTKLFKQANADYQAALKAAVGGMMDEREMTLKEWCDRVPKHHLINKQLKALLEIVEEVAETHHCDEDRKCLPNCIACRAVAALKAAIGE